MWITYNYYLISNYTVNVSVASQALDLQMGLRNWSSQFKHFSCFLSSVNLILTHWGRVTHICVSYFTSIVSDNGLSPGRCQAIIWTNAGVLLIEPLATNFSEILIGIHIFSFNKIHLKKSSGKWRAFCLGLNVSNKQMGIFEHIHW